MATNVIFNLPVPTANGPGAPVDVSTMGATKTVIVGGVFVATVSIEFSTAPAGNFWAPVPDGTFGAVGGRVVTQLAAKRMRAVTSGFVSGVAFADVAGAVAPTAFAQLTGANLDISAFPEFKTVFVDGACNVEISDDGTNFNQVFSFQGAGGQSAAFTAQFARVTNGVTCWLGGADVADGSGNGTIIGQAAGVFQPVPGVQVNVPFQSGQFVVPGSYIGVGVYDLDLVPIPGVTAAGQLVAQVTPNSTGAASTARASTAAPNFSVDHGIIEVRLFDAAGAPIDAVFNLHVDILA